MDQDLSPSNVQRQNLLNNQLAVQKVEEDFPFQGIIYKGQKFLTKSQVARLFEVDERTVDRYVSNYHNELNRNGYTVIKGKELKLFKEIAKVDDTHVVDLGSLITSPQLGIFNFKSVLNLAMLLTESDRARQIRSQLLTIAVDVMAKKVGGQTKYINQRDEDYLPAAFQEENYWKDFTKALDECVEEYRWKYARYTDYIYKAIFEENSREYRRILNLKKSDKVRDTFYAEVLDVIASFEAGFAEALREKFDEASRKLSIAETDAVFSRFSKQATLRPLINKAKTIMASRDYCLRDAIHDKLRSYIRAMPEADYQKFLGERSKALEERITDALEVYKRLKDR